MRLRVGLFVATSLLVIGFTGAVFLAPGVVFDLLPPLSAFVASASLLAVSVAIGAVFLVVVAVERLRSLLTTQAVSSPHMTTEPEELQRATDDARIGSELDTVFEEATTYGSHTAYRRHQARSVLEAELRERAITAYASSHGCGYLRARVAINSGTWTARDRAAGLLSGPDGPSIPLRCWLADLLRGRDPYEEAVEATVEAIEQDLTRFDRQPPRSTEGLDRRDSEQPRTDRSAREQVATPGVDGVGKR